MIFILKLTLFSPYVKYRNHVLLLLLLYYYKKIMYQLVCVNGVVEFFKREGSTSYYKSVLVWVWGTLIGSSPNQIDKLTSQTLILYL